MEKNLLNGEIVNIPSNKEKDIHLNNVYQSILCVYHR